MTLRPIARSMTTVIAERDLVLVTADKRTRVRVRVGCPVRDVDTSGGRDWRCPIQLSCGRLRWAGYGLGVDALQALVDALKAIEVMVADLETRSSGHLEWLDFPWHGLPTIKHLTLPQLRRASERAATKSAATAGHSARERRRRTVRQKRPVGGAG